jgi:hypothetical protein
MRLLLVSVRGTLSRSGLEATPMRRQLGGHGLWAMSGKCWDFSLLVDLLYRALPNKKTIKHPIFF